MLNILKKYFLILLICASAAIAVEQGGIEIAGFDKITAIDPNLTGEGVSIGLVCRSDTYSDNFPRNDYRPDVKHKCLKDGKIKFFDDQFEQAGISQHSTKIASILVGVDVNAFYPEIGNFSYRSASPEAQLNVYEFWHFITENVFTGVLPKDDLLTMSLGSSCESWWSRGIDVMAERYGLLVVAAIGNGTDAYDLSLYPAAGANVLAVGVADSNNSLAEINAPLAEHSTAGPTHDGRCKPDVVAGGNCIIANNDVNEPYKASGDYSSFAAPVVTGLASILIQKAKSEPNLAIAASGFSGNCVMKSILMTSAVKLPGWHKGFADANDDFEYPLDFKQGAGMVDGLGAYNLLVAGMQKEGQVGQSGWDLERIEAQSVVEKIYRFQTNEEGVFAATVVWNRSYQQKYPFNLNIDSWNDLQLTLRKIDADGNVILIDYSDSPIDNVEHIYKNLEANTVYELAVSNSSTGQSKAETTYAISWQMK
ncbi:MAG: S8 family serine peptidase [Phycisphaerales bacterium]